MLHCWLKDGKRFVSELIAGSQKKINGMYVEYHPMSENGLKEKDAAYYERLLKSADSGFARIAIQSAVVDKDGYIQFTALLTTEDLKGGQLTEDSVLTSATLVHMPSERQVDDVLIYNALFGGRYGIFPIKIVKGAYTTVNLRLSLGD